MVPRPYYISIYIEWRQDRGPTYLREVVIQVANCEGALADATAAHYAECEPALGRTTEEWRVRAILITAESVSAQVTRSGRSEAAYPRHSRLVPPQLYGMVAVRHFRTQGHALAT